MDESNSINELFSAIGLRSTAPRRHVLRALTNTGSLSPAEIHAAIRHQQASINLVTVYRVLEQFVEKHIVHKHPCNGTFSLCTMPDVEGHHGFLHCQTCNGIEEFANPDLCRSEDRIARSKGFQPANHVSEILGTCARCLAS